MALHEEPDGLGGVPDWVVTFADMMSLLLTFFIMFVSLSDVKQQEQYQAMVDSLRRRFGHDASLASLVPGRTRPRNSAYENLATMGRAQRFDTHKGGDKQRAPVGDHPRVRIVRPGSRTAVGTVVHFPSGSIVLDDQQKEHLLDQTVQMHGKPQKIEVRGHTSLEPAIENSRFKDHWDLAYARCRVVMEFLVEQGIDARRIRLAVAGANEPVQFSTDPETWWQNPRVEVHVLDEVTAELEGVYGKQGAERVGNRPVE